MSQVEYAKSIVQEYKEQIGVQKLRYVTTPAEETWPTDLGNPLDDGIMKDTAAK